MQVNFNNFTCDPFFCEDLYLDYGDFVPKRPQAFVLPAGCRVPIGQYRYTNQNFSGCLRLMFQKQHEADAKYLYIKFYREDPFVQAGGTETCVVSKIQDLEETAQQAFNDLSMLIMSRPQHVLVMTNYKVICDVKSKSEIDVSVIYLYGVVIMPKVPKMLEEKANDKTQE